MNLFELFRLTVLALVALTAAVALGSWAIRTRRINPFSSFGQTIRKVTDPILAPIETWQLRRGGNPQSAGWWLLGIGLVGGIVGVTVVDWLGMQLVRTAGAASTGPRGILRLFVYYATQLLRLALLIRVVGSWFGAGRYNRWVRWAYTLTDWIVEPLRKIIPPFGMIDFTPLIAWFAILIVRGWLIALL